MPSFRLTALTTLLTCFMATLVASPTLAAKVETLAIEVPHSAKVIPQTNTLKVFQAGLYHFYDGNESFFKTKKKQGATYPLSLKFSPKAPHQFSYGGNQDWLVVGGKMQKASDVRLLRPLGHNRVSVQGRTNRDSLVVSLQSVDVSGKPIRSFLRAPNNRLTKRAEDMSSGKRFSQGAIAYFPTYQVLTDKVVIPNKDVLTGAKTLEGFIKTFSESIPNCLRYEKRSGSQPYAIRFVNRKGNSGEIEIFRANRASLFCEAKGPRIAKGSFQIRKVDGTRVMELTFPRTIDHRDVGIRASEKEAVKYAFVQVTSPRQQVLPGLIIHRGRDFHDYQYRFNATAAADIRKALR